MKTKSIDKAYFARSSSPEKIEIVRTSGNYIFDSHDNKYIDFVMGWCVGNFGWGNEEITEAMHEFNGPEYVYSPFLYKPWGELAELLADITPGNLVKSFRTTGGTGSVETAMKIAMLYTGRTKFLSVEGSYHGNSIAALSIGASENKEQYKGLLPGCYKIQRPLDSNAIEKVESKLKNKDIAAFIFEPVLTHPGIHVPQVEFMQAVQRICRKHGTLLVMDEVATGFGRTGKIFASEHFEIKPDVMCLAKAISGGYAAIGAAVTTEKIAKTVEGEIHSYPTYGWHPVSVNAAIASIKYMIKQKDELLANVAEMSALFRERLLLMEFSEGINLNMKGLAIGVDVGDSDYASKICKKALAKGLLIESNQTNLMMFPALNLDLVTANDGLDILEECI